jgi:sarcosine oxidase subunit alpha
LASFVPGAPRQAVISVGAAAGRLGLRDCLVGGWEAGAAIAGQLGLAPPARDLPTLPDAADAPLRIFWSAPAWGRDKAFIDIQDDVTADDVALAAREGYQSVEHLKRYTTLGMGTDQGKTSNVNGLAIMAGLRGLPIERVGTTTFRPPFTPVAIGALAGAEVGPHFKPIRRTPLHEWHLENHAVMVEAGLWMRPRFYPQAGEGLREAYIREAAQVRKSVGIVDVSTLGRIDIQGPDAGTFLDRVYVNGFSSLGVGRGRYGLMLRQDGIIFDDGVTLRLADGHFLTSTTTANAGAVLTHLEYLAQVAWPDLRVHLASVTDQWAGMAVSGPSSRQVLQRVTDVDIADAALPHMAVRHCRIGGVPALLARLSYSGERAYEVMVPAGDGIAVWQAILNAGQAFDIVPYGTEAMGALRIEKGHVAGAELNGRTTADDLGLGKLVSAKKDFIGKRMAQRPGLTDPARPKLVGLVPVDPAAAPRSGAQLIADPKAAPPMPMLGHVTSTTYSPALGHSIALALLSGGLARRGELLYAADPLRGRTVAVRVVDPVFLDPEGVRLRG